MDIIFVDGKIPIDGGGYSDKFINAFNAAFDEHDVIAYVDAAYGVNKCQERIEDCLANDVKYVITNDIVSWGNQEYSWDDIENKCCAYIYYDDLCEIFSVEELTDKEIRKSNNLEKMYLNGAFAKPSKLKAAVSEIINAVKANIGSSASYKKIETCVMDVFSNYDFLHLGSFLRKLTENPWIRIFEVGVERNLLPIYNGHLESIKNADFINNYFIDRFETYDGAVEIYVRHV